MKINIDITQTGPQKIFTENDKKFKAMVTGVGAGKTAVGWHNALKQVFGAPGSLGVIVAPTYAMIRDVILREREMWIPDELIRNYNKTDKEMTFINGSTILFRSAKDEAQIERLRGLSVGWSWIDEATLLPKLVLDILTARLRQPGMEGKYKLWMTCTPRKGWLYDMIQTGLSDEWFILDNIESSSNTFLPDGYTESLKALYTGQFYDQEVLGKWVDFEGLVWNVRMLEGVLPDKMVNTYYGIDIGWEHPTSIIVIKEFGGIFYVVDEFYETHTHDDDVIRELSRLWGVWGSGRSYVDPSVPRTISKLNGERLHANAANNKVMDGLRVVRALFDTGKLFIHPRCINLKREIEGYIWKDGDKEEPEKINDDACFVPGTMISTDKGDVPIEDVEVGDMVMTRNGYREVVAQGMTGAHKEVETVVFSNGKRVTATPNHPVYVEGKGFIPLSALRYGDITKCIHDQLYLKESNSIDNLSLIRESIDYIISHTQGILGMVFKRFIKRCGSQPLEIYRKGITSIIEMAMHLTMKLITLCVKKNSIIYPNIVKNTIRIMKSGAGHILKKLDHLRRCGIEVMRGASGIVSTVLKHMLKGNMLKRCARCVDVSSRQKIEGREPDFARINVSRRIEGIEAPIMLRRFALYVMSVIPVINMMVSKPAHEVVRVSYRVKQNQRSDVYNLSIEGTDNEYFANGILVHNCDGLRYGIMGATGKKMHKSAGVVRGR